MKSKYLIFFLLIMLTGCNTKELEDRDFVMVMGIENDNGYKVYTDIARLDNNGDSSEIKNNVIDSTGDNLTDAIKNINNNTSGELFLGHLQAILLEDINLKNEVSSLVANNMEIGRDIPVLKCDNIKKVLNNDSSDVKITDFITKYFENNKHKKVNLESFLNTNENTDDLPLLTIKNSRYNIE